MDAADVAGHLAGWRLEERPARRQRVADGGVVLFPDDGCLHGAVPAGDCLCSLPEMWRQEVERQERELKEKEDRRRELYEELDRKYKGVPENDDSLFPSNEFDRDFNKMFGIKPPSRLV